MDSDLYRNLLGKQNYRVVMLRSSKNILFFMSRNVPARVIDKVGVMFLLSVKPCIGTDLGPFALIVCFPTDTHELGV